MEPVKMADFDKAVAYVTWIDMERRVRTDDDSSLDMDKVRTVLELVIQYESIYLV